MAAVDVPEATTGFSFELCKRNELLKGKGVEPMPFKKTGTTIAGVLFKDGVVLGADTRATADTVVADKNCAKIHYLTENMRCCGAGTAADTEHLLANMSSRLKLHRYATGRGSRVITALSMLKSVLFQYQGNISAALILGGVDLNGPQLFTVFPHGSSDSMPFATMGSGSLNAMAVFETDYKDGMSREEAMALVTRAIRGGIFNDLGSGSNVDLCVITKDGTENLRNYEYLQGKTYEVQFPIDLTMRPAEVTKAKEFPSLDKVTITEGEPDEHAMDTT